MISLDPSSEQFLANLNQINLATATAQRQLSSGIKLATASDAPDSISAVLQLQTQLAGNTQAQTNLKALQGELKASDQALTATLQLTDQALTLATSGAGNTQTPETRAILAQQVQSIQQQIVGLANTSFAGRYLFSGDNDQNPPYQYDAAGSNGARALVSFSNTRQVNDGSGQFFTPGLTAQDIFDPRDPNGGYAAGNLLAGLQNLYSSLTSNDAQGISDSLAALRGASTHVTAQQTAYGNVQNRVTSALNTAAEAATTLETSISDLRDADATAAAIALSDGQTHQQAAYLAQAKRPHTSLFDFLG